MTMLNRKEQAVFNRMAELLEGFGLNDHLLRALSRDIVRQRRMRSKSGVRPACAASSRTR